MIIKSIQAIIPITIPMAAPATEKLAPLSLDGLFLADEPAAFDESSEAGNTREKIFVHYCY